MSVYFYRRKNFVIKKGALMTTITDEFMRGMLQKTRNYCFVILKQGPNRNMPGAEKIRKMRIVNVEFSILN